MTFCLWGLTLVHMGLTLVHMGLVHMGKMPDILLHVLIFVLVGLLMISVNILRKGREKPENYEQRLADPRTFMQGSLVDCTLVPRFCSNSGQCNLLCTSKYECSKAGVCELSVPIIQNCNNKHGFISVLRTTEFDQSWMCLNTMPHMFKENGELRGYVCGTALKTGSYDLSDGLDINNCSCNNDHVRVVDDSMPNVPLCVPKNIVDNYVTFNVV